MDNEIMKENVTHADTYLPSSYCSGKEPRPKRTDSDDDVFDRMDASMEQIEGGLDNVCMGMESLVDGVLEVLDHLGVRKKLIELMNEGE